MEINGITLDMTCGACPEQYDAFDNNAKLVGYLRLRHGYFRVRYYNSDGTTEIIYEAQPKGDGAFVDRDEREFYLDAATKAISKKLNHIEKKLVSQLERDIKIMDLFVKYKDRGNGQHTETWNRLKKILEDKNV